MWKKCDEMRENKREEFEPGRAERDKHDNEEPVAAAATGCRWRGVARDRKVHRGDAFAPSLLWADKHQVHAAGTAPPFNRVVAPQTDLLLSATVHGDCNHKQPVKEGLLISQATGGLIVNSQNPE